VPSTLHRLTQCSDRQPVPDNQEAFLTPRGPFSAQLIFEITDPINLGDHLHGADCDLNLAAIRFYMDDLTLVTNDTWRSVKEPRKISLGLSSMNQYAGYYLETQLTTRSSLKTDSYDDVTSNPSQPHSWLHLLFIRVPQHESEFVIQMVVKNGNLSAMENLRIAQQVVFKITETLEFKNFKALVGNSAANTNQEGAMTTGDGEELAT
jgi:hypothetical protein